MADTQVLVVGAGPTGLNLALRLAHDGVPFRIIDQVAEPGTTSRALVVHARTLEFYSQLGMAEAVTGAGVEFSAFNLWVDARHAARAELRRAGRGISPFPAPVIYPQDEHERMLIGQLEALGHMVERGTALLGFEEAPSGIAAALRRADGAEERCTAAYLAGCDGARSRVRAVLGTGFPGSTYTHVYYVADVQASGPVMNGELHVALDKDEFIAAFPLRAPGHARLIGTADAPGTGQAALRWEDVRTPLLRRLGVTVERVNWFSTYHVHHRVAAAFRRGRVFLLGDAAHIHSPVGGQGMNTGIGDAVNLGWKLAAVLQGRAAPALLDTYEPERIAFARRLVATTDQAFTAVTSPHWTAQFVRTWLAPRLLGAVTRPALVRRLMFRTVSQTAIHYRRSAISEGRVGPLRGGDRLPWLPYRDGAGRLVDNYAPLRAMDWQAHLFGTAPQRVAQACADRGIPVIALPWSMDARRAGFRRGALYLVRPDGYLGLVARHPGGPGLEHYMAAHAIRAKMPPKVDEAR